MDTRGERQDSRDGEWVGVGGVGGGSSSGSGSGITGKVFEDSEFVRRACVHNNIIIMIIVVVIIMTIFLAAENIIYKRAGGGDSWSNTRAYILYYCHYYYYSYNMNRPGNRPTDLGPSSYKRFGPSTIAVQARRHPSPYIM